MGQSTAIGARMSKRLFFRTSASVIGLVCFGLATPAFCEEAARPAPDSPAPNVEASDPAATISVGSATNSYSAYPIAPRQWFLTLSAGF